MVTIIISIVTLLIIAIVLRTGKGSWLIAGYNSMSEQEKEKYNEKKLCKDISGILFGVILALGVSTAGELLNIPWLITASAMLILVIVVAGVIVANVRNHH